jgi:1,4-dihydroxy-2-naphthoate octaprenyltransferase
MNLKHWILALRPKTLAAAVVPVLVGTALVKSHGAIIEWWISVCAMLSAVFIQVGTNFVNDAIDFHKGADSETRIGPIRVTQSGLLESKHVMIGAFVCFAIALGFGVPLVFQGGWPIVVIGLVSLCLAYGYTGGPFPLAYIGLGDLFVVIFFGLVAVMGTFYLHLGYVDGGAVVAGLQVGMLATVLIAINNFRDAPEDVKVGKKTLAVRFGYKFARIEIAFLVVAPYLLGIYWYKHGLMNAGLAPIVSVPIARRLLFGIFSEDPSPVYNRFLAMGGALLLLFGILLSLGMWFRVW